MKRIVSFLIAVCSFFSICTYGWASNGSSSQSSDISIDGVISNSKIQFRGIPFGTSYSEVITALEKEGLSIQKPYYYDHGQYRLQCRSVPVANLNMIMTLDFICPDHDNYYDAKVEDCVLFRAEYYLGDSSKAKGLHEKLCVLYGDTPFKETQGYFSNEHDAVWIDEDVIITLHNYQEYVHESGPAKRLGKGDVSLTYAWKDGENLEEQYSKENSERARKQAEETRKKAEEAHQQEIQNSDKTGL